MRFLSIAALSLLSSAAVVPALAAEPGYPVTAGGKLALEILKEAVAVPTVAGRGQVPVLAEKLKARLIAAGFAASDVAFTPMGETGYLTARYRGRDSKAAPIVVMPHMDVVEAKASDWTRDPFTPEIENGFLYGRGSLDDKSDLALTIAAFSELKRAGWVPSRDIVFLVTGDEETEMATTQAAARVFSNASLVLNADGGGGEVDENGKPVVYGMQAAEKVYADYTLTVTDPGGHSSRPHARNAIVVMNNALNRIAAYRFPAEINPITKAYFEGSAPRVSPDIARAMRDYVANPKEGTAADVLSAQPEYIGLVRTTCIPTMVNGGHAPNAQPQSVTANVNCRIFPGTPRAEIEKKLNELAGDPTVKIEFRDNGTIEAGASPLDPAVVAAVTKAVQARAPGVKVVPNMSSGATDSMHFRALGIPAYGVSAVFMNAEDELAHGLDERVPLATIDPGVKQWETLLRLIAK